MEGTLCTLCAELDIYGSIERLLSRENNSESSSSVRLESPWHTKLAAVDVSSPSCSLCKVIMKGWQWSREVVVEQAIRDAMFDPQDPPPGLNDAVARIPGYRDAGEIAVEVLQSARTVDDGRENTSSIFLRVECGPAIRGSFDVLDPVTAELRIIREKSTADTASTKLPPHTDLLVSVDPLSQESLDIARGWLETCVKNHGSTCNPPTDGYMPTRLLEVVPGSSNNYLRDLQTLQSAQDARYVALSHCWGQGGTPFTTTHPTLRTRMEGIDVMELPQTFRDSVVLTERLGLRYLWIDSLCIIQDDAEDWAREAAQMANVYRNAHLVLNAANSPADNTGFLFPRDITDTVRLALPAPGNEQLSFQLLLPEGRRWSDPAGRDNLIEEPISARAWCLQERYLPVRALQYGSHQTFWECVCMRASEDGDAIAQNGSYLERFCETGNIDNSVFARSDRDPYSELDKVNWVDWYKMVEDYTARSITKHTDRLPALSGLAQAVTQETKGEYLAGLWKSGLLEGLLWCKTEAGQILGPAPEYVAPSWSWASVTGPVQFPAFRWYTERASWKSKMCDFEPLAEYISHQTTNKDPDLFGRLEGGHLTLKAPLLSVLSIRQRQPKAPVLHSIFGQEPSRSEVVDIVVQMKTDSGRIWIEGGFDNTDTAIEKSKLSVVLLTRLPHVLEEGFVEHRFGLILERLEGSSQYRRVGFVDGVVLEKSILRAATGRGLFSVVGYARQFKEGDMDEVEQINGLARDPLKLKAVNVTIY
jgi:hypothetical protein